jgi:hypothetical protein
MTTACEHGLLEHDVGVEHALVHVPLVVHGLRGATPAHESDAWGR